MRLSVLIGDTDIRFLLDLRDGRRGHPRHELAAYQFRQVRYAFEQVGFTNHRARLALEGIRKKAAVERRWELRVFRESLRNVERVGVLPFLSVYLDQAILAWPVEIGNSQTKRCKGLCEATR